jgi:hypothetical protein
MALESKLKNSRNSENDKKDILYLDSWPKTVCFAIGNAASGGDPDVGRYAALTFQKISGKLIEYRNAMFKNEP